MKVGDLVETRNGIIGRIVDINWRAAAGSTCCYPDSIEIELEDGTKKVVCATYIKVINPEIQ